LEQISTCWHAGTVAKEKRSHTGQFLKAVLAKKIATSADKERKRGVGAAKWGEKVALRLI
jgi:hypothetical protein